MMSERYIHVVRTYNKNTDHTKPSTVLFVRKKTVNAVDHSHVVVFRRGP